MNKSLFAFILALCLSPVAAFAQYSYTDWLDDATGSFDCFVTTGVGRTYDTSQYKFGVFSANGRFTTSWEYAYCNEGAGFVVYPEAKDEKGKRIGVIWEGVAGGGFRFNRNAVTMLIGADFVYMYGVANDIKVGGVAPNFTWMYATGSSIDLGATLRSNFSFSKSPILPSYFTIGVFFRWGDRRENVY